MWVATTRDVRLARVPAILRVDIYATAALLGALVVVVGLQRGLPRGPVLGVAAGACFASRILSVWLNWQLPRVAGG